VVLGVIDDWRLVVRRDASYFTVGDRFRVVWTRIHVRDFPLGDSLGLIVIEKGRCQVIEIYPHYVVMQSIADPETTPWLVNPHPDMPSIAVGDEVQRL
jgi:hypothetical protein